MIYLVGLEPLKERYTYWWDNYFPDMMDYNKIKYKKIEGTSLTDKVETGTFLDAGSTNHYKATQLQKIAKMFYDKEIEPYSKFLICDIWFPGIEMIRYMSQLYNIPVTIWGVWHAGSSTNGDAVQQMHIWSKYFEIGFLGMCDGVFVGSDYSKDCIAQRLMYPIPIFESKMILDKIYAWGMPLDIDMLKPYQIEEKKNIILFPHRPDEDKNLNIFIDIISGLSTFWDEFENYTFVFCTSKERYKSNSTWLNALLGFAKTKFPNVVIKENLSKEEYYTLLGQSKLMISTTCEENFGYCAVEALGIGTQVLLPNDFSYPEIVENNSKLLYDSYDELLVKIPESVKQNVPITDLINYVDPYKDTLFKWLQLMGSVS